MSRRPHTIHNRLTMVFPLTPECIEVNHVIFKCIPLKLLQLLVYAQIFIKQKCKRIFASSDAYMFLVVVSLSLRGGGEWIKKYTKLKMRFILRKTNIKFYFLIQGKREKKIQSRCFFSGWWKIPQMNPDILLQKVPIPTGKAWLNNRGIGR